MLRRICLEVAQNFHHSILPPANY
uniref:Uncharacterized protein n=1 Tax=Arundo donax TaxID=35708 RepID=A0A0A8Y5W5_ARUDO